MFRIILALVLITAPTLVSAQEMSLQNLINNLFVVINDYIIPFLLAIAFLIFVFNAVRFFVIGSHNEDGQEAARYLATYSILAFVFLLSLWGIVNLLIGGIFGTSSRISDPCVQDSVTDYISRNSNEPCSVPRPPSRPDNLAPPSQTTPLPPTSGLGTSPTPRPADPGLIGPQ